MEHTASAAGPQHAEGQGLPLLLTPARAARELSLSRYTVHQELRAGRLRAKRYGRSWLIPREELERFIANLGPPEEK